jgi:predicted exporter
MYLQTRNLYMSSERREVAMSAEMDQALSALRQSNTVRGARGRGG